MYNHRCQQRRAAYCRSIRDCRCDGLDVKRLSVVAVRVSSQWLIEWRYKNWSANGNKLLVVFCERDYGMYLKVAGWFVALCLYNDGCVIFGTFKASCNLKFVCQLQSCRERSLNLIPAEEKPTVTRSVHIIYSETLKRDYVTRVTFQFPPQPIYPAVRLYPAVIT